PLWNPWILGGAPHAANPLAAAFYPLTWLLLLVDPLDAPILSAAVHVFLAGVFFHLWLRCAGLRPWPSLFGALAFALSGWVAGHLQTTPLVAVLAWLPLALCGIELRRGGASAWSLLLTSGALAMSWLAGFPQLAALASLAAAGYGAAVLGPARGARDA